MVKTFFELLGQKALRRASKKAAMLGSAAGAAAGGAGAAAGGAGAGSINSNAMNPDLFVERHEGILVDIHSREDIQWIFPGTELSFYDFIELKPERLATRETYKKFIPEIGRGTFGSVYHFEIEGIEYVLKYINLNVKHNYTRESIAETEIRALQNLDGIPFALQIEAAMIIRNRGAFILSFYIPGLTLDKWLQTNPEPEYVRLVYNQLIEGIHTIHSRCILHNDIKEQNIWVPLDPSRAPSFLNPEHPAFYLDFGGSTRLGDTHVCISGTAKYMRKNINYRNEYEHTPDIDYHALHVIFTENYPEGYVLDIDLSRKGLTNENVAGHTFERAGGGGHRRLRLRCRFRHTRHRRPHRRSTRRRLKRRT